MQGLRLFSLLLLSASAAWTQPADPLKTVALSFGIQGLDLSLPEGGGVGGKIWLPGSRALALGVLGGASRTRLFEYVDSSSHQDTRSWDYQFGVRAGLEQHFNLATRLSPYLVGASSARLFTSGARSVSANDTSALQGRTLFLEFSGGAGLEWWLTRRLSLTGQQLLRGGFHLGKEKWDDGREHAYRGFSLGIGTSILMLNVYL